MFRITLLVALLGGGGLLIGAADRAAAGPGSVAAPAVSPSAVERAGWRRYCRRYGCGPDVMLPGAAIVPGAGAELDGELDIELDAPAVMVLPPPRPLSCGQYRYWDGRTCVDARYTDPYLGPK